MNVLIWTAQSINLSTIKETERHRETEWTDKTERERETYKTDNINIDGKRQ